MKRMTRYTDRRAERKQIDSKEGTLYGIHTANLELFSSPCKQAAEIQRGKFYSLSITTQCVVRQERGVFWRGGMAMLI
jgi:hypothetical protein